MHRKSYQSQLQDCSDFSGKQYEPHEQLPELQVRYLHNSAENSDPEKYKDMTTQKLNKLFNIPGYKITKIKGEICLRKIKQENHINNDELEKIQQQINEIKEAFNLLTEQFETIKTMVIGQ